MLDKGALHWQRCWPTLKAAALRFLAPNGTAAGAIPLDGAVETGGVSCLGAETGDFGVILRGACLVKGGKLHQLWRCGKSENPKNCQKKIYFQLKHQLWPTCRRTSIAVSYAALITLVATWPWINGQIKHFHCLLVLLQIHGLCGHLYLSVAVNSRTPSQPRCAPPPQRLDGQIAPHRSDHSAAWRQSCWPVDMPKGQIWNAGPSGIKLRLPLKSSDLSCCSITNVEL